MGCVLCPRDKLVSFEAFLEQLFTLACSYTDCSPVHFGVLIVFMEGRISESWLWMHGPIICICVWFFHHWAEEVPQDAGGWTTSALIIICSDSSVYWVMRQKLPWISYNYGKMSAELSKLHPATMFREKLVAIATIQYSSHGCCSPNIL